MACLIHAIFLYASYLAFGRFFKYRLFYLLYFYFYFTLWIVFYALIFISNSNWGDTIPFSLVKAYFHDVPALIKGLPVSSTVIVLIIIIQVVVVLLVHFLIYRWFDEAKLQHETNRPVWEKWIPACVIVILSLAFFPVKRAVHMQGEPLSKFAYGYMWWFEFSELYSPGNIELDRKDAEASKTFIRDTSRGNGKNIIVIVVDALRADHLSTYGYERNTFSFVDSVIREGKAFRVDHAFATTNSTVGGITTLFLSKRWQHVTNKSFGLPEALHRKGYKCYGVLAGYQKGWYSLGTVYRNSMDLFWDGTDSHAFTIDDDRTILQNMDKIPDYDGTPHFFYFHFVSTHQIGFLQDQYRQFKPDESDFSAIAGSPSRTASINRYDNRILQVNDLIRQLYFALKEKKYLENSVIVLTSDHGQSLGEGGRTGHGGYMQKEGITIPLIIFDEPAPYVNKSLARQIDISPTLIERVGLPVPATWEGKSLLHPLEPALSFHENATARTKMYSIIYNDTTGIYRYLFSSNPKEEELGWTGKDNREIDKRNDTALLSRFRNIAKVAMDTAFKRK